MNIFLDNGYVNIEKILSMKSNLIFMVGGRGTGKTFGAIMYCIKNDIPFMFLRRTQSQADLISTPEFNPFNPVAEYMGVTLVTKKISKYCTALHKVEGESVELSQPIAYTAALSTISNLRGFDASRVELLLFDEFIPERHERPIRNEASAFFNAIETIGRNRELKGCKPLKVLCLANSNSLANPIFDEMGLVDVAERMSKKRQQIYTDPMRGVSIIMLYDSPISEQKKQTALYKYAGGRFAEMSVGNTFAYDNMDNVRSRPLYEYRAVATINNITVYRHKSKWEFYATKHYSGSPKEYGAGEDAERRFVRAYPYLYDAIADGCVYYADYESKKVLTAIFGL